MFANELHIFKEKRNKMEEKFLDHTVFDYSQSSIIKPPFKQATNNEVGKQYTRMIIDSRDRDMKVFPSPNKYTYNFDQDIDEITSAEIIIMDIPLSGYIINENNNKLKVNSTIVTIPIGNYDGSTLAIVLTNIISNVCTGAIVTYNTIQDKLQFDGIYILDFIKTPAIAKLLGFLSEEYTCPCQSIYRIDLNVNKYIIMNIEQFNINVSSNSVIDRTTALIHAKPLSVNYVTFSNMYLKKFFNPPVKLNKLRFTFMDYYGNLYDFQNQDHRIEILFESRKNLSRYTHYV